MKMNKWLGLLLGVLAFPAWAAVNVNTATQAELEAVKGLGPAKARAIVAYRKANGDFKSLDELKAVKGFGKSTINKLRNDLTASPPGASK